MLLGDRLFGAPLVFALAEHFLEFGELLGLAGGADSRIAALAGECPGLDSVAEQNPFATDRVAEDDAALSEQCLAECRAVLTAVKEYLAENRERFFAP